MNRRFSFGKIDFDGCGQKRNLVLVDVSYVDDGGKRRFSVTGNIKNAKCTDSICAGQCLDTIAQYVDDPVFNEIFRLWKLYHLNDMHPECEHQAELGWRDLAQKEVRLYHYKLTYEALKQKHAIERNVIQSAASGNQTNLSQEERVLLVSEYSFNSFSEELPPSMAAYYKFDYSEKKTLGWLKESEHPEGILCRPCPVCGYKYGTAWKYFPIPEGDERIILHLLETGEVPA